MPGDRDRPCVRQLRFDRLVTRLGERGGGLWLQSMWRSSREEIHSLRGVRRKLGRESRLGC